MKRPAACSKQRPSACTMKKLPKPKRSRSKAALQEKKAALQRKRRCDNNLRWRVRKAQKEGTPINPRSTRNCKLAAQVIHLEKNHRHLEKKQNDLEEKHLVMEKEQKRCISLTEKANHDFCRVQDHSLEAQAKATQALDDAFTNRDEMKRIKSIQDKHESMILGVQAYLQVNAVQLSRHNALPLSTNPTSPVLNTPEKLPKPRKDSSRVPITNCPSQEQGDVDSIYQTATEAHQKATDALTQHTDNQHRLNQLNNAVDLALSRTSDIGDIRRSLKSLQQSSLTSQCRGPSSELREESSPRNITTTLASSREVSPTCIA